MHALSAGLLGDATDDPVSIPELGDDRELELMPANGLRFTRAATDRTVQGVG